jgi:hypothetical protein
MSDLERIIAMRPVDFQLGFDFFPVFSRAAGKSEIAPGANSPSVGEAGRVG